MIITVLRNDIMLYPPVDNIFMLALINSTTIYSIHLINEIIH